MRLSEFVGFFPSFDGDRGVDETLDRRPDDVCDRIRRVDRRQMLQRRQEGHGQRSVGHLITRKGKERWMVGEGMAEGRVEILDTDEIHHRKRGK